MGMLSLNCLMLKQERRQRQRFQARTKSPLLSDGPITDDHSQAGERSTCLGPHLPEDIWCLIHSLMPLRDSARSACVSGTFLRSWRCRPILTFNEETLGLKKKEGQKSDIAKAFASRVDCILKNHLGTCVKILEIVILDYYKVNACHLNSWLKSAIRPGIEEVTILLPAKQIPEYIFPCSMFVDGCGNSIRYLHLSYCTLRPTVEFDHLRSLTKLHLFEVLITGDELGCLISSSFSLEELELRCCWELFCLKIPFWLERFSCLRVDECNKLQVIESTAPNLSTVEFFGEPVQLMFGESSQVKNLMLEYSFEPNAVNYAITKLPSIAPHLETLILYSTCERVNTPIVADKFLHLKHLDIYIGDDDDEPVAFVYDYLSLVAFFDASPALESFTLCVDPDDMKHDSVLGDTSSIRQIPRHSHDRLKKVQVNGFFSAKSMFELICHIIETATSLESLMLDCIYGEEMGDGTARCSASKFGKCRRRSKRMVLEAHKALSVINKYIVGRIPSAVKLSVGKPCSRCHAIDVDLL
ncbi:unnamed protein product [Urochloa decumbens]|uniref:At1g61320/AtMIF1 LRR domain-containing protein n=1 Tax=Urochloa decumbens TaxID=240449 RepID=A0ABC9C820_9POAL